METKPSKYKITFFILLAAALVFFALAQIPLPWPDWTFALLEPKGIIAKQQKNLIITAVLLMLFAVIPAYALTFFFAYKYRAGKNEKYSPDMQNNKAAALIWLIPASIIFIIAGLIWKTTHELDPYKPIESNVKPLTIQVVTLRWKWLFIYPEQNIATINFVQFPKNTPVEFELTADSPMNTFWIPQLGGQVYAMEGMKTELNLMANEEGEFSGQSSEISGKGYSSMRFVAKATSKNNFDAWVAQAKQSQYVLSKDRYNELAKPSEHYPRTFYFSVEKNLFTSIIMKFMAPASAGENVPEMQVMSH